ncbi:hypothetical protein QUB56_26980 [Microcoleus sp. AR_TQ3_B6]|uniref:hypothetical protein n=1 Tax=Microcoleus sp. AR_TQ3_B6 TaxID=3055284 RepID=UPI002FCF04FA
MEAPDLEKYAQEVNDMQMLPAAFVELPPLSEFAKIAIDVAKQLQNLFNQDSETYKVLELGWNPEADILTPSGELGDEFCEEPCDKFLQNLGCHCTGNRVAELATSDEQISLQTLAAGAAMMHQFAQSLESKGFELLDM